MTQAVAEAFSSHYLISVVRNNTTRASQWYNQGFGAEFLHEEEQAVTPQRTVVKNYLQLGATGRHNIIEISDTLQNQRQENHRRAIMCIYTDDAVGLFNRAIALNAHHESTQVRGECVMYHIKDPFGYFWLIVSRIMIPQPVLPLACQAHYWLLIDHNHVPVATQFYNTSYGAAIFHQRSDPIAIGRPQQRLQINKTVFLRLGQLERHIIIEIISSFDHDTDTFHQPPVEENRSEEMLCIYTENLSGFVARATLHGAVHIPTEGEGDNSKYHLRDPFGYQWVIASSNLMPEAVLNINQD